MRQKVERRANIMGIYLVDYIGFIKASYSLCKKNLLLKKESEIETLLSLNISLLMPQKFERISWVNI